MVDNEDFNSILKETIKKYKVGVICVQDNSKHSQMLLSRLKSTLNILKTQKDNDNDDLDQGLIDLCMHSENEDGFEYNSKIVVVDMEIVELISHKKK